MVDEEKYSNAKKKKKKKKLLLDCMQYINGSGIFRHPLVYYLSPI